MSAGGGGHFWTLAFNLYAYVFSWFIWVSGFETIIYSYLRGRLNPSQVQLSTQHCWDFTVSYLIWICSKGLYVNSVNKLFRLLLWQQKWFIWVASVEIWVDEPPQSLTELIVGAQGRFVHRQNAVAGISVYRIFPWNIVLLLLLLLLQILFSKD